MSEVYDDGADAGYEMSEEEYRSEVTRVLRDYQAQQLRLHLIGPVISLLVHVVVLVLMSVLIVGNTKEPVEQFVVETIELEVVELEEEILEELDEVVLEEVEVVEAPTVEVEEVLQPAEDISEVADVGDMLDDAPLADDFGDVALDDMLTVMDSADTPLKLEGLYSARSGSGRAAAVGKFGGSKAGQAAVDKALAWLARIQRPDGSWGGTSPVASTGMALLVFLAHGETPLSETYGSTVQNAMKWLSTAMMNTPTNGLCGGRAYSHGIATYALAEAYGMTRIPFLRSAMDKGLDRIIAGQQSTGGFDYRYAGAGQVHKWDLSVGGWQFQALKAGYAAGSTAAGLESAIEKSVSYLKNEAYGAKTFGYSSTPKGNGAGNMTGVGTVALQLLGERDSAQARGGVETIAAGRLNLYRNVMLGKADWKTSGRSIYGWYYDTQAMFNAQGKEWREWQPVFEKVLISNQHPDGYWAAEGHGFDDKSDEGRILSTCWCVLQLEVYYRYLPTYDIKKMDQHRTATTLDGDDSGLIIK